MWAVILSLLTGIIIGALLMAAAIGVYVVIQEEKEANGDG